MDFKRILKYCKGLEQNNDRTWFHNNHDEYEQAKKDFIGLIDFLRFRIAEKAPELADDILYTEAKEWMYRVARDMRFYKNRPPYDPSFRAYLSPDKKSWKPIGYYIRIANNTSCFGTGLWCESTEVMNCVRRYIRDNFDEFITLYKTCPITLGGSSLKKLPRGFEDTPDEMAPFIKLKNWELIIGFSNDELTTFEDFTDMIGELVERTEPMRQFLLRAARSAAKDSRPEFEW